MITVNESWKPLTIITKRSILDVAAVLDPSLDVWADTPKLVARTFCSDYLLSSSMRQKCSL